MKKGQSSRLTEQQKEGQGPITIFHKEAQIHDTEVGNTSLLVKKQLEFEFPMLKFRYRKDLSKKEINKALKKIDKSLGQTLFVKSASIKPDGGIIEVKDDNGNWRVVLVSEAKHQGKDIENIRAGKLVGKKNDQDIMAAGNAIDRLTAANYGMPINTNLCKNKFVKSRGVSIMLQAASIYTKGEGGHWNDKDMIEVMFDVARTSLKMLGTDLFSQITKK